MITTRSWDAGISWRTELVSIEDDMFLALPVVYVAEKILRVKTDGHEDDYIENLIRAATELCEFETGQSIRPQRLKLYLSGFPAYGQAIYLPGAPIRDVRSISYYDSAEDLQEYGGSPPSWTVTPGGRFGKASIHLGEAETWPTSVVTNVPAREDAVVVEYDAGYEDASEIPHLLKQGIGMCVLDLYQNPDGESANKQNLARFWPKRLGF